MNENQNVEWKQAWHDDKGLEEICGLANAQGGKMLIGIDDKGTPVGLSNAKDLLVSIPDKIKNVLGILCETNLHEKEGKPYIEIIVPHYDTAISCRGRYYFRSGSANKELAGNALTEFLLKKSGKTWGDVIEPSATLDDISPQAITNFIDMGIQCGRLNPDIQKTDLLHVLKNLHLIEAGKLKRAAILIFGKHPINFFPHIKIHIGKFGKTDSDLLFQDVIEENALHMAEKVLTVLKQKYLVFPISYEGLQRIESLEYPEPALREVLLNAIIHRNYLGAHIQVRIYEDKLMVWNEGKLPEEFTVDTLKGIHPSRPPNRIIADIFFRAGQIEQWGRGTLKIIQECVSKGLPEPEFQVRDGGIWVTLYRDIFNQNRLKSLGLSHRQIKAVLYVKEYGKITNSEYQKLNQISKATASLDLNQLDELQILSKHGKTGKGTIYILHHPQRS